MNETPSQNQQPDNQDNDLFEMQGSYKFRMGGKATWQRRLIGAATIGVSSAALAGIIKRIVEVMQ